MNKINIKVLKVRHYKAGYEVRTELTDITGKEIISKSAYTPEGNYIGSSKTAYRLCKRKGIIPELAEPNAGCCTIGFSPRHQKWYGWSHRALYGFAIGDVVKKGSACATTGWIDGYVEEHPEADKSLPIGFTAKTLDDCKKMAIAFAESVG